LIGRAGETNGVGLMGTNALPAAIEDELELELIQSHMAQKPVLRGEDDLSRGGCIAPRTRARCTLNSYGYFCEPQSAGPCGRLLRAIHIFGRGRNGVTFPGDALPHELNQRQRETLTVGKPAEQHVQDAQDLRKVDLVRHLFIRQV